MFEPEDYDAVYAKYGELYRALVRVDLKDLEIMKVKLNRIINGEYTRMDITQENYFPRTTSK